MALVTKTVACPSEICDSIQLFDATGEYNAITNPNGWNAPNPLLSSATACDILFFPPGYTTPITVDGFAATPQFPSIDTETPQVWTAVQLGFANGKLPEGIWTIQMIVTYDPGTGPTQISCSTMFLVSCTIDCCINKKLADLTAKEGCKCDDDKVMDAIFTYTMGAALCRSVVCGNINNANKILTLLTNLCTPNGCKGC